jgi:hypothetical protein
MDYSLRCSVNNGQKKFIITLKIMLPLERIKPPNAKSRSSANDPNVLATIIFLPSDAINRNNAEAIWFTSNSIRYCLKNLQCTHFQILFIMENT